MTYPDALAYIAGLSHRGWRLGLDRMEEFIRRAELETALGDATEGPRFIHVGGTNGKGSVTAYLESMLRHSGYRTGAFYSPFVYDIRERIQALGRLIPEADLARLTGRLAPFADGLEATELGGATEFEFKTAMGFAFWQEMKCDWVALEVGLGGRLDATNVVRPACATIVTVGLDHTAILGETHAAIATEKAGIFKPGVPAVVGSLPDLAQEVIEQVAKDRGCPLWTLGREYTVEPDTERTWRVATPGSTYSRLPKPLPGRHQVENLAVAVASIEASGAERGEDQVRAGLANTYIPGRFERRTLAGRQIILDGAHNSEAMEALLQTLQETYPGERFEVVFGMVEGHDPVPVCRMIDAVAARVYLAPIDFHRAAAPKTLQRLFASPADVFDSVDSAMEAALHADDGNAVLVAGSFYLVGEAGNWLSAVGSSSSQ